MPEKWTGILIGRMHNEHITRIQLADKLGVKKAYISMILNGKRNPPNAKERLNAAVDELLTENQQNGTL